MVNELLSRLQGRFGKDRVMSNRNEEIIITQYDINVLTDTEKIERLMERCFPETPFHVYELTDDDAYKRAACKTISIDFESGGDYFSYFILVYEMPPQITLSFRRGKQTLGNNQRDKYLSLVKHMFEDGDI